MERKTSCENDNISDNENYDNQCEYCANTYSTHSNLVRHYKTCSVKNNTEDQSTLQTIQQILQLMQQTDGQPLQQVLQLLQQNSLFSFQYLRPARNV